jgi:FkbM family methyltransferase
MPSARLAHQCAGVTNALGQLRKIGPNVLCSAPVGRLVAGATRRRPPSRGGVRVDLRHPDVPAAVHAAVLWRMYERAEIGLIHRHLPRDLDVVELGASLGVTGTHVLALIAPGRRLIAVEANPRLIGPLRRALDDPRAVVVHAAIASVHEPTITFELHPSNLRSRLGGPGTGELVEVPSTSLGALLDEHALDDYALVADVEGAEAAVVLGEPAALDRCRVAIIELHRTTWDGEHVTPAQLDDHLRQLGFRRVDGARSTSVYRR